MKLQTKKLIRGYPKEDDMSLGAALKRERLNRGWTQKQVALHIKIPRENYVMFERNNSIPNLKKMKRLNTFLGFNFWDDGTGSLANRLFLYRIQNELSAKELGKKIGVSRTTIKRIELSIEVSYKMKKLVKQFI